MAISLLVPGLLAPIPPAFGQEAARGPAGAGIVSLLAGGAGSTDTEIAAELAYVLADEPGLRVMPVLSPGDHTATAPSVAELLSGKGVDVAIVHTDTLLSNNPSRSSNLEYIAKLFQEEVHILTQNAITTLADLNGKPVEVGPTGSATALTAHAIFNALHVAPEERHDLDTVALERLRLGQAMAVVIVGGEPVPALLSIPPLSGLHFLPIPLTPQLVDTYLPSLLESSAYPGLVPPDQPVETVAVGSLLVTLPRRADGRGKRIDRFVDGLFASLGTLRQPGFHPKWRDVSLTAQFPGLKRHAQADRLLRNAAQDIGPQLQARH